MPATRQPALATQPDRRLGAPDGGRDAAVWLTSEHAFWRLDRDGVVRSASLVTCPVSEVRSWMAIMRVSPCWQLRAVMAASSPDWLCLSAQPRDGGEQGAGLGDDALLELRVADLLGSGHRGALLVVVDSGGPGGVQRGVGYDRGGPVRGGAARDEPD